ncbi:hypothetical protein CN152_25960 [Sinorhizobium meliloti]|nr:hypothetical protein CN152_25960 [Sinorhizobium meliloti]
MADIRIAMRKTRFTLATTLVLTLGLTEAHAIDGKLLFDWCGSNDPELLTYVSGVVDTLLEDLGGDVNIHACIPGGTTRFDIMSQTCAWLEESPDARHVRSGARVVIGALQNSYPCP